MIVKLLNGRELADYIKVRQARQARSLRQSHGVQPKLAIIQLKEDPVIDVYINLKQRYGRELQVDVEVHKITQPEAAETIGKLNEDRSVHGIIVQLPIADPSQTQAILDMVDPSKDVDSLGAGSEFEPATPMAILWLLAGYNIETKGKKILLIGRGKLVGAPLERILKKSGNDVEVVTRETEDLARYSKQADIIITATGSPAILFANMIKPGAVVVDAGVASEDGKTVGDVADDVYTRDDLVITPKKGGVGPLTVCALFENVLRAATNSVRGS